MSTRQQQKQQRRQLILMKALELFVKKGYSGTRIGDIAKAADMSVGLMFHYFASKEELYAELVRMGAEGAAAPAAMEYATPLEYFQGFLNAMFAYAKEQPWVFQMFVLMSQARRSDDIPQHIRQMALQVDQIGFSAQVIAAGQPMGYFRQGDPYALSFAFWNAVQGIMEAIAACPETLAKERQLPDTQWLLDIIRGVQ